MKRIIRIPAFDIEVETVYDETDRPPSIEPEPPDLPEPPQVPDWNEPRGLDPIYPDALLVDGTDRWLGNARSQFDFQPGWTDRVTTEVGPNGRGLVLRKQFHEGEENKWFGRTSDEGFKNPVQALYSRITFRLSDKWPHAKDEHKWDFYGFHKGERNALALTLGKGDGRIIMLNQPTGANKPPEANEHCGAWRSDAIVEPGEWHTIERYIVAQSEPGEADGSFWLRHNGVLVDFQFKPFNDIPMDYQDQDHIRWLPSSAPSPLISGLHLFCRLGNSKGTASGDFHIDLEEYYLTGKAVGE